MSFRCQICDEAQPVRTPPVNVVLETRPKSYPKREYQSRGKIIKDSGGTGREIVKVAGACGDCAANSTAQQAA